MLTCDWFDTCIKFLTKILSSKFDGKWMNGLNQTFLARNWTDMLKSAET